MSSSVNRVAALVDQEGGLAVLAIYDAHAEDVDFGERFG